MAVSTSVQHALSQFLNKAQNIFSVSVDSASRAPGESLSNYTVHFREPLQRVKSVQLGSITLPEAARYPFPQGGVMPLAEPLDVPPNAGFTIQETTKLVRGGVTLGSYTTHTTAWLAPTLNRVVATPGSDTLTLEAPHHLAEVARFYPPQLQARCVGTAFPTLSAPSSVMASMFSRITDAARAALQPPPSTASGAPPLPSAPVAIGLRGGAQQVNVTPATLAAADTAVNATLTFLPDYLASIAPPGQAPDGSWFYNADAGTTSYLHTTQPTLSELLMILNAQLVELGGGAGVPEGVVLGGASVPTPRMVTRVEITVDDAGAALVMRARPVTRTLLYEGEVTQATTTAMLVPTPGTGSILGDMFCSVVRPVILSNAMEARFLLSALWQLRTPATRPGAYAPAGAAAMLSSRLSPLTLPAGEAGFQVLLPSGAAFPVAPPQGRYTGQQLAAQLSVLLQPASVRVDYLPSDSPLAGTARFRFSHTGGLGFGLNFEAAPAHAAALGFDAACYSGGSAYASQRDIVCVPSGGEGQYTRHNYSVLADASASRFSVRCAPPLGWVAVGTTDGDATWAMSTTSTAAAAAAAPRAFDLEDAPTYVPLVGGRYKAGDVLVVQNANSFTLGAELQVPALSSFTVVVNAPWSGATATPDVQLVRTVSLAVLPAPSPAQPLLVAAEARTAFQLPFCVKGAVARQCGFSPQLYPVLPALGQAPVFGAEFGGGGSSSTAVYVQSPDAAGGAPSNMPCAYGAPFNWNLLAPRYILLRLKAQAQMSCRNTHVYKTDAYPIFTKLIMLDSTNFYTMRDDLSNYTFTDFARVERVEVTFTYGDGSPVDFNGVDHSITLLFNTVQGSVDEISI